MSNKFINVIQKRKIGVMNRKIKFFCILYLMLLLVACNKSIEQQVAEQLELGQKYLLEENYEKAVLVFEKVIELDPKQWDAYKNLAIAYEKKEDYLNAYASIERGIEAIGTDNISNNDLDELLNYYKLLAKEAAINEDKQQETEGNNISDSIQKSGDELRVIVEQKFPHKLWGSSFFDYDGDGKSELFADGRDPDKMIHKVYYCSSDGEICKEIYNFDMEATDRICRHSLIKGLNQYYEVYGFGRDTDGVTIYTKYYIFGVKDGNPALIEEGTEASILEEEFNEYLENIMRLKEEQN